MILAPFTGTIQLSLPPPFDPDRSSPIPWCLRAQESSLQNARRLVRIIAFSAIALLIPALPAQACSCPSERPPIEAIHGAAAVFEGTVVDQRAVRINIYDRTSAAIDYEVRVTRIWKGSPGQTVRILRPGPCDPAFRIGSAYLIYAAQDDRQRLLAVACARTRPIEDATIDITEHGAPVAVFERATSAVPASMPNRRRVRAVVVLGLAVYASMISEWRDALISVEAAWVAAVALEVCLGVLFVRRRRSRAGVLLVGAAVPTALLAVIRSGQRVLQNEWFSPFLMWSQ